MKHTLNKYISSTLGSMVIIMMALSVSSCRDELSLGYDSVELGQKVTGSLSVPLNLPLASQVTRSVDFSSGATIKVNDYWIGVYDTHTRELLGNIYDAPLKADNTREELKGANSSLTKSVDIWYYDKHPEVYVVGVVNLMDVKGKKAGTQNDFEALKDLLENAKTWDDFCNICLDVKSMQEANKEDNEPILMGYYTSSLSAVHPMVKAWDNNDPTLGNMKIPITESNDGQLTLANGAGSIKLNRLISEVNVTVGGPELTRYNTNSTRADVPVVTPRPPSNYYPDDFIKIKNLEYKVLNNPKTVYLAEHATDPWSYNKSESEYPSRSSNSSDYDGAKGFEDTDWIKVENGKSFTFQHYENKHIGHLSDLGKKFFEYDTESIFHYAHQVREEIIPGTDGLLSSLCLDRRYPANNYAPAFKIRADVEINFPDEYYENNQTSTTSPPEFSATVEYTIHEGYSSNADGSIIDGSNIGNTKEDFYNFIETLFSDFQRRRNTQYNYTLSINGFTTLVMQAMAKEMGYESEDFHDDGISGNAQMFQIKRLSGYGTFGTYGPPQGTPGFENYWEGRDMSDVPSFDIIQNYQFGMMYKNRKNLKWRFLVHNIEGELNFGNWTQEDNKARGMPPINGSVKPDFNGYEDILNSLKIVVFKYPENYWENGMDNSFEPYPKGSEFAKMPPLIHEWTIQEFINAGDDLFSDEDFIPTEGKKDLLFGIYIPELKVGNDVPYSRLEEVYRNFYFKIPIAIDEDECSFNSIFGYEQTVLDNRTDLSYYGSYFYPTLNFTEDHPYTSYSSYYDSAHNLVNWITWSECKEPNTYQYLTPDYYLLKIDDTEIIVDPAIYKGYDGLIHYPLYVDPSWPKGFNTIYLRPIDLKRPNGEHANYKVSQYLEVGRIFIQDNPYWNFNSSGVFNSAYPYNDTYTNTVERYGLIIRPGNYGMVFNFGSGYIQTEGSGSVNSSRSISTEINRPGTFRVKASGTSGSTRPSGRLICLGESGKGTVSSAEVTNLTGELEDGSAMYLLRTSDDLNSPTTVSIYSSNGSLRIYSIEFIPD